MTYEEFNSPEEDTEIDLTRYTAAILDMDGVLTNSAQAHAAAWKQMFDNYIHKVMQKQGREYEPFDDIKDYYRYVDGIPRYQGAKRFLESRGIYLSFGDPDDLPEKETISFSNDHRWNIRRRARPESKAGT